MAQTWTWGSVTAKGLRGGWGEFVDLCNRRFKLLEIAVNRLLRRIVGVEVVYAHEMPGADWGQKVAAAEAALPAAGGIIDATYLTGAQSLSGTLTLSKDYVTLRVAKDMVLAMGTSSIVWSGGTVGCRVTCEGAFGALSMNGAYPQPQFNYAGSGSAVTIGDGTTASYQFVWEDIGIRINAAGTSAVALTINTLLYGDFGRLTVLGSLAAGTTQVGCRIDGTHASLFAGWITFRNPVMNRVYRGFHGTGSGVHTANAITILGGSLQGANNYASGTAGKGIYLEGGKGWFVHGLDIDNFERAVDCNTANNHIVVRAENCDQGIYLDSSSDANWVVNVRDDGTTPVDNGTDNVVWQAGIQYGDHTLTGNIFAGGTSSAFGGSGGASAALLLKAAAATTRVFFVTSGNNNLWGWGANTSNDFFLQNYDGSGTLIDKPLGITTGAGGGATWTRKNTFPASTTSAASANLPHGTAPTSPVNGDVWTTTAGIYVRVNGATVGPLGTGGGGGGGSSGMSALIAAGV